ncbi:MAG: hypothetical protein AAGE84_09875 [Cyanobacteria bacterium P01_G01_bin.39]
MSLSIIISIAITLTFVYLLLSIATSEILEITATVLNLRGKNLKQSIINLLGEQQGDRNLFTTLFNDIIGNNKDEEDESKYPITNRLYQKYLTPALSIKEGQTSKPKAIGNIQSKQFASGLIATVREIISEDDQKQLTLDPELSREKQLEIVFKKVENSRLPEKLKTDLFYILQRSKSRLTTTEAEINHLEQEVQDWFDYSMQYASEIYQRKVKVISFVLGIILVLAFNVDTVNIVDQLSKSDVLTSEFNTLAMQVIESNPEVSSCSQADNSSDVRTCINSLQEQLNIALDNIDNLPIGWNLSAPFKKQFSPLNFAHVFNALLGWFISAIAVSMGAPFWFNVLKKLVNIKSSQTNQVSQVSQASQASQTNQINQTTSS